MFEDRFGPCSEIVVGDQLQLDGDWFAITAITENANVEDYLDFILDDPDSSVITRKSTKRLPYRHWVEA